MPHVISNLSQPSWTSLWLRSFSLRLQITAEQILREARELQEHDFKAPKQKITDETELAEYRLRKRKEFEDLVRRVRWNSSVWVKVSSVRILLQTNPQCMRLHTSRIPSNRQLTEVFDIWADQALPSGAMKSRILPATLKRLAHACESCWSLSLRMDSKMLEDMHSTGSWEQCTSVCALLPRTDRGLQPTCKMAL